MMIAMKRAETLMSRHLQSQLAGNLLYREIAQLFYFVFFHFPEFHLSFLIPLQVFLCLRVKSRLVREGDEFAEHPLIELIFRALFRFT